MKRVLFFLSVGVGILALLGFVATWPVESSYQSRAQLVQRVQVDQTAADLFGDEEAANTPVGSPQLLVIDDPKAFLAGNSAGGAKLVDEGYLISKGIYPLQLQTVSFILRWVRIGCAIAFVCSLLIAILLRKRIARETAPV